MCLTQTLYVPYVFLNIIQHASQAVLTNSTIMASSWPLTHVSGLLEPTDLTHPPSTCNNVMMHLSPSLPPLSRWQEQSTTCYYCHLLPCSDDDDNAHRIPLPLLSQWWQLMMHLHSHPLPHPDDDNYWWSIFTLILVLVPMMTTMHHHVPFLL